MLAKETDEPFDSKDWTFEIKWDGYRAVAEIRDKKILLYPRNGLKFLDNYPVIADKLKNIKAMQ